MTVVVSLANVTLACDAGADESFSAASASASDSPSFLSAAWALARLGLDASLMVEGTVTVSEATGWPMWPLPGVMLGVGASLLVGSRSGLGVIDFAMNADRIILPTTSPTGRLTVENLQFTNLCTTYGRFHQYDVARVRRTNGGIFTRRYR